MTREQAILDLTKRRYNQHSRYWGEEREIAERDIDAWASLGMLKFEEPAADLIREAKAAVNSNTVIEISAASVGRLADLVMRMRQELERVTVSK